LIRTAYRAWIGNCDVIVSTGGTGITGRDVTPEAVRDVATKEIPGFGELFRFQGFASIGTAAIQSRAIAAVAGSTLIFALPGSKSACRDAWEKILVHELDSRHKPCNFAELIPRLSE
jgi:molybdopterin adenylyltransferase